MGTSSSSTLASAPPEDPDFNEESTPFVLMTRNGRVIWSYLGVYDFISLYLCTLLFWTCIWLFGPVVFGLDMCFYLTSSTYFVRAWTYVWIISFIISLLFWGSYVSLLWLIFDTYLLCVVCGMYSFLYPIVYHPSTTCFGGWRYWMVGGNRLCIHFHISVFFVCIDGLHRAYFIIIFICYSWCILLI